MDSRSLFAFVVLTSFISGEHPPSAERLYDKNQSEGNRPYTSSDVPSHRYRHERKGKGEIDTWGEQERKVKKCRKNIEVKKVKIIKIE